MARSRASRITLIVLATIAVVLLAAVLYPFASALLFAAVLAGAFQPWLERLSQRLGDRRQIAASILTVAVALVIVLPASILTVAVGKQVVEGIAYVGDNLRAGGVPALIDDLPPPLRTTVRRTLQHVPRGPAQLGELAESHTQAAAAAVGDVLVATSSLLVQTGLMLVALFFLLVDGPRLVTWIGRAIPMADGHTHEICADFRNVSVAVLLSSLATAGVQALAALAGYLIAGVPQALFFTAVTFVAAFIPVLGAASVSLVLAGLLLVTGKTQDAAFLATWGVVVVGLVDNVVKPLLMKGRMEIHGALIFFAILGGFATFGAVGLVAGPLILAFFLSVVRLLERDARLREG